MSFKAQRYERNHKIMVETITLFLKRQLVQIRAVTGCLVTQKWAVLRNSVYTGKPATHNSSVRQIRELFFLSENKLCL